MTGKDASIAQLLAVLPIREHAWVLVDHWDADRFAIGIASRMDQRRLVYISTFKQAPGRYYYECEVPRGSEPTDFETTASGEGVALDELVRATVRHLSGHEGPPRPGRSTGM